MSALDEREEGAMSGGDDVIAALATPFGEAAIAVVRLSGADVEPVAAKVLRSRLPMTQWPDRTAVLATVVDGSGAEIDEVLATLYRAPASYTGETVLEISGHGGVLVAQKVLEALFEAGARAARPGEFTQRAFMNGKLDLTQAEAVMDLIRARSGQAMEAARRQLGGALGRETMALRQQLIEVTAELEAYIDFPEEDIDAEAGQAMQARLREVQGRVGELLATADRGRILREGLSTAIVGEPNVGKSSLLNFLSGEDRAIVSERPGTTRDTVEGFINLRGVPLRLIDTAGLRESGDEIERLGMERSRRALEAADLVLLVVDGSCERREPLPEHEGMLLVLNKADRHRHESWEGVDGVWVSCLERTGVDELAERVWRLAMAGEGRASAALPAINARHQACLRRAREALDAALGALVDGLEIEFVAADLREAVAAIGEIAGKIEVDEVLGEIFGRFCIGK